MQRVTSTTYGALRRGFLSPLFPLLPLLPLVAALSACGGGGAGESTAGTINSSQNTSTSEQSTGSGQSGSGTTTPSAPVVIAEAMYLKDRNAVEVKSPYQFNVTINSSDGTPIVATVYVPKLATGEATPLLLHSHGFGGSRVTSLDFDEATQTSEIGIDVMQLAYNKKNPVAGRTGWYVISYDQRGHGDSGGKVAIMDPSKEGEDFKAVMNWAENNLPHLGYLTKNSKMNPVVGTIGRSYGGAFQLMGAGIDDRIDAMVPGGTWNDLRYSLYPGGVPKTSYLDGLVAAGAQSNRGRYEDYIFQGLVEANTTGEVSPGVVAQLGSHGAVTYCGNSDGITSPVPVTLKSIPSFFVQGAKDVLFNLNEGISNFECYRAVNPDSKLLMVKFGHSLSSLKFQADPATEIDAKYAFNESKIWLKTSAAACPAGQYQEASGRCVVNVKDLMFQFLVQHLMGQQKAIDPAYLGKSPSPFPEITTVLEDGSRQPTAIALPTQLDIGRPKVPGVGAFSAATPAQMIYSGLTGFPDGISTTPLGATPLSMLKSSPITDGSKPVCFVGTPKALVNVATPAAGEVPLPPIVYVGLTLQKADGSLVLLHDQVTPVKGYGQKLVSLPGISVKLAKGEKLGFVAQGYSPFFPTNFSKLPTPVNVNAQVALPVPTTDAAGACQ